MQQDTLENTLFLRRAGILKMRRRAWNPDDITVWVRTKGIFSNGLVLIEDDKGKASKRCRAYMCINHRNVGAGERARISRYLLYFAKSRLLNEREWCGLYMNAKIVLAIHNSTLVD